MRGGCFSALRRATIGAAILVAAHIGRPADLSRRLFDFDPVSETNPVVAAIDDVEIPVSELRGYLQAERPQAWLGTGSLEQKRAFLDELITEYLLVDEGYRRGVAASPSFKQRIEATRTLLLTDLYALRMGTAKSAGMAAPADAASFEAERLFEAATIDVSNEAHDVLRRAAATVDLAVVAARRGPVVLTPHETAAHLASILRETPDRVLVRYLNKIISVRQLLAIYSGLPEPRPRIDTPDGLIAMIKPQILPELMAFEAAKRGLESDPEFQAKLAQNRNILLRFHAHGVLEREANLRLQGDDLEPRLLAWYATHKHLYAPLDAPAAVPDFSAARARVLGDYSVAVFEELKREEAARLRRQRNIRVEDRALARL